MNTPYDGKSDFSDVQRLLLLALLDGPIVTVRVVARGAAEAALELREINLVEWNPRQGWRLTLDGSDVARRIAANPDGRPGAHENGTGG